VGKATVLLQASELIDSPMEQTLDGVLTADDFEGVSGGREGAAQAPVRHGYFLHQHTLQDANGFEIDGRQTAIRDRSHTTGGRPGAAGIA